VIVLQPLAYVELCKLQDDYTTGSGVTETREMKPERKTFRLDQDWGK